MIKQHTISYIEEKQEPIFESEPNSVIVRKTILHKDDNIEHPAAINRYAEFINRDACILLHGVKFDDKHHFFFQNEKLYIKHDNDLDDLDEEYWSDDDEDFPTFEIRKYFIEGKEGWYWNTLENYFWIWGDLPPEL